MNIPLPAAVHTLASLFKEHSLFVAGGVVRDYFFHVFHGMPFEPKDVDLATEALPWEVASILNSKEADKLGIHCFPKGEAFGVISAMVKGVEYEIATFREEWYDPSFGDGRRPNQVSYSTPENDAKRRDLTMNALLYDLKNNEIRDYVGGIEDIKNMVIRPVGNARERFREDKLRIPRLVRFFCRFHDGDILSLDPEVLEAVNEFRDLQGISGERIANEFTTGLQKCKNSTHYLESYYKLGLMPAVFPGMLVEDLDVGNCRNFPAVLAWMFHSTPNLKTRLIELKYPSDVARSAKFLVDWYCNIAWADHGFGFAYIADLLRERNLYKQLDEWKQEQAIAVFRQNLLDFARIVDMEKEAKFFLDYQPVVKSKDYLHLKGKEIRIAMAAAEATAYQERWKNG